MKHFRLVVGFDYKSAAPGPGKDGAETLLADGNPVAKVEITPTPPIRKSPEVSLAGVENSGWGRI